MSIRVPDLSWSPYSQRVRVRRMIPVQEILEKVATLARESHLQLNRFEPVCSEEWNADKCLYRLEAQGGLEQVSQLCDSLEQTPFFEVEELTLHGDPGAAQGNLQGRRTGIGVEILLQVCAERSGSVSASSGY